MISTIGSHVGGDPTSFASSSSVSASGAFSLKQAEEQMFASIDTDGDGKLSRSELTGFLNQVSATSGGPDQTAAAGSLFSSMDSSGDGSIDLQEFQTGAHSLADQLRSQLSAALYGSLGAPGDSAKAADASDVAKGSTSNSTSTASNPLQLHQYGAAAAASGGATPTSMLSATA